eukprot:jgi/Chrpa1/12529/Chrysochromulina_OHIO_Genome00016622-RA
MRKGGSRSVTTAANSCVGAIASARVLGMRTLALCVATDSTGVSKARGYSGRSAGTRHGVSLPTKCVTLVPPSLLSGTTWRSFMKGVPAFV